MKETILFRKIIVAVNLLLQVSTLCHQSRGAAGDVDLTFDPGSGVNGTVNAVLVQPDGKVLIGGYFTTVKGLQRFGIARLNPDGSGDLTFDAGVIFNMNVTCLALQPDGKVVVGGRDSRYECDDVDCYWVEYGGLARLNPNGSLDGSFTSFTQANATISAIALQGDGKILIGGTFSVNATNGNGIARLNVNGTKDNTFDPGSGAIGYPGGVNSIAVQPDGKVLIGGGFNTVNGTNRNGIARLNTNGGLDSTFNPGSGISAPYGSSVRSLTLYPDGKVLIGGAFTNFNGTNRYGMARLFANGSLDTTFDPGAGVAENPTNYFGIGVNGIALQSDGKVLIGGFFNYVNGTNRSGFARLNTSGTLDLSFNPLPAMSGAYLSAFTLQSNGTMFIARSERVDQCRLSRVDSAGNLDNNFDSGSQLRELWSLGLQPDGKVVVGKWLAFVNGTNSYGEARRFGNGSPDGSFTPASFNPDAGLPANAPYQFNSYVHAVAVQPDGKVIVGANFETNHFCDSSGCLTSYGFSITRHNADGSRDGSFEPSVQTLSVGSGSESVLALAVQADGKVLVGGSFTSVKGATRRGLARLNANGTLDTNFIGSMPMFLTPVRAIVAQPDGQTVIASDSISVNGVLRNGIARLNADASVDDTFNAGSVLGISSMALQPDGKLLIGGNFTAINGTNRNCIARLNIDGSLDTGFNPGTAANGTVRSIALQPDGKVLIGGYFTAVNGVVRPRLARLYGHSIAPPLLNITRSSGNALLSWPVTDLNFQLQENSDLALSNSWSAVTQPSITNNGIISVSIPTTANRKFFRLIR